MGQRITTGEKMPFFRYDTPYSHQNSFRTLLAETAPLVVVFLSNFGHPVTREYVLRYARTRGALQSGGLAMVVRSNPAKLTASVQANTLPYPLLCDAQGVLYEYLDIPQKPGGLMNISLEAMKILHEARKKGYHPDKNALQQMPLTLVLDGDGTVLFCHYGTSLTDLPEDGAAMERLLAELDLAEEPAAAEEYTGEYGEQSPARQAAPAYAATRGEPVAEPRNDGNRMAWANAAEPDEPRPPGPDADSPADLLRGSGGNYPGCLGSDNSGAGQGSRHIRRTVAPLHGGEPASHREKEEDTHEFPVSHAKPLGPAKGYPQPLPGYDYSELEKTMDIGYFNDPYADE